MANCTVDDGKPRVRLTHYTDKEGGNWAEWRYTNPVYKHEFEVPGYIKGCIEQDGILPKTIVLIAVQGPGFLNTHRVIHAMRFDDGSVWDAITGFRKQSITDEVVATWPKRKRP